MAVTAGFVLAATVTAERAGPLVGGLVSTLPIGAGPVYVFLALDHDAHFIAQSAVATLAVNAINVIFALVYALLAPSLIPGTRPWWLAVVAYPFLWISHDDPFSWALGLSGPVSDYALAVLMMVPLNLVGMFLLWLSCQETLRRGRSSPP